MVLVFVGDCNTSCSLCSGPVLFSFFTKKISMPALLFSSVDIGLELDFAFIFFKVYQALNGSKKAILE